MYFQRFCSFHTMRKMAGHIMISSGHWTGTRWRNLLHVIKRVRKLLVMLVLRLYEISEWPTAPVRTKAITLAYCKKILNPILNGMASRPETVNASSRPRPSIHITFRIPRYVPAQILHTSAGFEWGAGAAGDGSS